MNSEITTEGGEGTTVTAKKREPIPFHTRGSRWRFSDGTVLRIGPDGAARREAPRVRLSKKARRLERRKKA